ncbi:hypothetical protein WJX72_002374 [[Myrmecia] bisecta]|uniref:Protein DETOXIFICATION n=1 Tax=[Myrmecia] bisecta TaxID=41462 RepID=A0AAW1PG01_9CHLO
MTKGGTLSLIKVEAAKIMRLAWPISGEEVLSYSQYLVTTAFVGRLGSPVLSAWFLAKTLINVTGNSLVWGIISAMETFCGQAFGACHYGLLGVILQRALLIGSLVATPCAVAWIWADKVLELLGQNASLAAMAARYIHLWTPTLFLYAAQWGCQLFLQAQGVVLPALGMAVVSLPLTVLFNWLFIVKLGFGLDGAAFATLVLAVVPLVLMVIYLIWHDRMQPPERRTWLGWSRAAWSGWGHYLHVALPSLAMICLDWWGNEITIFMSGILPQPEINVAAMGIAFNTNTLFFMLSFGLAGAASTRVSNELGANHPHRAKLVVEVAVSIAVAFLALGASVLVAVRHQWARVFTEDEKVVGLVARLMLPLAASLFGDGIMTVLAGVLRGAGRQRLGALVNLITIWVVGLPLQVCLAFYLGLGAMGMWLAKLVTSVLQAGTVFWFVARFDWTREAARAAVTVAKAHREHSQSCLEPLLPEQ